MSDVFKNVDGRPRLAGTHKLEILLFTLGLDAHSGRNETFGIDVFEAREVTQTPKVTRTPNVAPGVEAVISLRDNAIPVIDLAHFVGVNCSSAERCSTLMVKELCGRCYASNLNPRTPFHDTAELQIPGGRRFRHDAPNHSQSSERAWIQ